MYTLSRPWISCLLKYIKTPYNYVRLHEFTCETLSRIIFSAKYNVFCTEGENIPVWGLPANFSIIQSFTKFHAASKSTPDAVEYRQVPQTIVLNILSLQSGSVLYPSCIKSLKADCVVLRTLKSRKPASIADTPARRLIIELCLYKIIICNNYICSYKTQF